MNSIRLGFQRCSDATVRALRMNGDELISTRAIGDLSTAIAMIDSFRRDFPKGEVQVENPVTNEAETLRKGAQLIALFDAPAQPAPYYTEEQIAALASEISSKGLDPLNDEQLDLLRSNDPDRCTDADGMLDDLSDRCGLTIPSRS